jgi:hypothetical protein
MKNSIKIFKLMMVVVLLISTTAVFAQDAPTLPDDPENVPIDGGISLLVAAGIGYGAKKMRDKKANIASADKN